MEFFDLNIPYHESDRHVADKSAVKALRLKLALKALELGYTGIAFSRILKGVMSESDRCSIHLFPLSSLLKLVPAATALSAAVKFHRDLLNVSVSSPFRQYTRLTVIVDNPSQVSTLNVGNPILRSYDIVAVRPLNQNAFDQACQISEVDIIAINLSERLPFRLKQPMVKAAISRGVYFEVTYSGLIGDVQTRRLLISNGKLLVEWTRGKNLIFSSAASCATELRGPQDVSNLLSLLGLPTEHAKAAISKNCRSLISNAMRKKQFYKEAVKVEEIPHGQLKPQQFLFDEWLKWDPISSGEGDLLLDDIQKSFCLSNTATTTVKKIDFNSAMIGLPAHGLQIKDLVSGTKWDSNQPDTANEHFSDDAEASKLVLVCDVPGERNDQNSSPEKKDSHPKLQGNSGTFFINDCDPLRPSDHETSTHGFGNEYPTSGIQESLALVDSCPPELPFCIPAFDEGQTSVCDEKIKNQVSDFENLTTTPVNSSTSDIFSKYEEPVSLSSEKHKYQTVFEENVLTDERLQDKLLEICGGDDLPDGSHFTPITKKAKHDTVSENNTLTDFLDLTNESDSSAPCMEELSMENSCRVGVIAQQSVVLHQVSNKDYLKTGRGASSGSLDESLRDIYVEGERCNEMENSVVALGDGSPDLMIHFNEAAKENVAGDCMRMEHISKYQGRDKSSAVGRRKRSITHQPFLFPFKFLKPCHLKRKTRKVTS